MRGSMLKQILDDKGITVSELARRLNAPAQTLYSMVKRDNQKVDFDLMMRICSELNVPVERMCENISLPAHRLRWLSRGGQCARGELVS